MEITHSFKDYVLKGEQLSRGSFLLTNKRGGFYFGSPTNIFSMYNGLFFPYVTDGGWSLNKTVAFLGIKKDAKILDNHFSHIILEKGEIKETYYMNHSNVLMYDVDTYSGIISLQLDCKRIYDFSTEGRIYRISQEEGCIIYEYLKYSNDTLSEKNYSFFVCIKSDLPFSEKGTWFEQLYDLDSSRGTAGSTWLYDALEFSCSGSGSVVISYDESKEVAIQKANHAFENKTYLRRAKKNYFNSLMITNAGLSVEDTVAYNSAIAQFDSLIQTVDDTQGIYAGLPWFFQYWSRDEAISTIGLLVQERYQETKDILFRWLKTNNNGRVANRFPGSDLGSADSTGWVFFRLQQLLQKVVAERTVKDFFTDDELLYVYQQCVSRIATIESSYLQEGLIHNDALETWMDTGAKVGDVRSGFRIEIQALHLAMYSCAIFFGKQLRLHTAALTSRANHFKSIVQKKFLVKGSISDGYGDEVIRPNIFIAAYVAPDLFEPVVWKHSFDVALDALSTSYSTGMGITTIDTASPLFQAHHTGENNASYHRGDVWYWVNSLIAVVLYSIDEKKYAHHIDALKASAVFAISWQGTAGCLAEISSAVEQTSQGCISQAWSYALLLELLHTIGSPR